MTTQKDYKLFIIFTKHSLFNCTGPTLVFNF